MTLEWSPLPTDRHQDHVIAHVIGATPVGYFMADDAVHILLDIGFVWTIYAEGDMALLPQGVAIAELEIEEDVKSELLEDLERLNRGDDELSRIRAAPVECLIREVNFYAQGERRRVVLEGEEATLAVETSLALADDARVLAI